MKSHQGARPWIYDVRERAIVCNRDSAQPDNIAHGVLFGCTLGAYIQASSGTMLPQCRSEAVAGWQGNPAGTEPEVNTVINVNKRRRR